MARKILLGGLSAGLALFVWGMISHMALGLTDKHVKGLPGEAAMLDSFRGSLTAPAIYIFPGAGMVGAKPEDQEAAAKAWAEDFRRGPRGLLVYEPSGGDPNVGRLFGTQLAMSLAVGMIAALLMTLATPATYGSRVAFTALLGLLASVFIDLPYWNWYSFPTGYTLAVLVDRTLGMTVAGLVLGRLVRPS